MDANDDTEESQSGPWQALPSSKVEAADNGPEKRTRRQRNKGLREELHAGGELNHGKVLRSHTRRNTEKTAATEWVSSRQMQHQQQQRSSNKRDVETRTDGEGERRKATGGGGTAQFASVISLSSSCQQSPNERKIPQEQAELGGTTSKMKATIEDASHLQTGSSPTCKGSTMGDVGRASKSKRSKASVLLQCSPTSADNLTISLVQTGSVNNSQHSKLASIATTSTAGGEGDDDDTHSSLRRTCSSEECKEEEEMSEENARHSPKESTCLATTPEILAGQEEKTRSQRQATGGSVRSHWSPPTISSDQSEQDEEKEEALVQRLHQDDEEELATSLKTLACGGQSETKFEESHLNSPLCGVSVSGALVEVVKSELAGIAGECGSTGQAGFNKPLHQRNDDVDEEWQVASDNNVEDKSVERPQKERPRIVLSPSRRSGSTMIQGGVEATPAGTEAPCTEANVATTPSHSPQSATSGSSLSSPPTKRIASSGSTKKRSVSDRVASEPPTLFKFKKPQQSKKCNSSESEGKSERSDNAVLCETSVGELLRNVVQPKKTQMSSVLMSNLPYMGELTFDTRPRRGRKPKKADICHLISKNYGIYFPSVAQDANALPPQGPPPKSLPAKAKGEASAKSKLGGKSISSGGGGGGGPQNPARNSPPASRPLLLPPNVPAFYNRDVSIVPILPTLWNATTKRSSSRDDMSSRMDTTDHLSASHFSLRRSICQNSGSQETISMFPLNPPGQNEKARRRSVPRRGSKEGNSEGSGMDVDGDDSPEKEDGDQDLPLNLCLRDDTGGHGAILDSLSLGCGKPALDVRWGKGVTLRINSKEGTTSSESQSAFECISPSITIIQGGKPSVELSPLKETIAVKQVSGAGGGGGGGGRGGLSKKAANPGGSSHLNLVSGNLLRSSGAAAGARRATNLPLHPGLRGMQMQSNEISVSLKSSTMDELNVSPISFSHRIESHLLSGGQDGNVAAMRQTSSKKKKELVIRPSVNSPVCPPPKSSSSLGGLSYSSGTPASSAPLSSLGGRLFGQSSGGINDGAEVSICKFKFTGGAKPSLQEKKMLSVDSGGNFRFYTDKTNNGMTTKLSKGHQFAVSPGAKYKTSPTDSVSPMGKIGLISEFPLRSEAHPSTSFSLVPESDKSIIIPPAAGGYAEGEPRSKRKGAAAASTYVKSGSKRTLHPAPSISSSSTSGASQAESSSLLPSREESKYFRLSMDGDQGPTTSTSATFPFQVGEDTNSSSNSCTSSDDSNENSRERGNGYELLSDRGEGDGPQAHFHKHPRSSGKLKLRRKRRTRKSLMREKLEKTFKEKGFLIQTQQLESAEGATYCKFRQLRKFTRYLFRSWKDYLPDNVKEISDNSAQAQGKETEAQSQTSPKAEGKEASVLRGSVFDVDGKASVQSEEDLLDDEIDVEEDPDDDGDDEGGDDEDDKVA